MLSHLLKAVVDVSIFLTAIIVIYLFHFDSLLNISFRSKVLPLGISLLKNQDHPALKPISTDYG